MDINTKAASEQASKRGPTSGQPISLSEIDEHVLRRFYEKVSLPDENGCMLWLAWTASGGYGQLWLNGRKVRAHRLAYIIFNGEEIPNGLVVRHTCDRPLCVAPDHLELGTVADNNRDTWERGRREVAGICADHALKETCPRGHELIGENLRKDALAVGKRKCRACNNARSARGNARKRGETWTDEELHAYADRRYAELMNQATLFDSDAA